MTAAEKYKEFKQQYEAARKEMSAKAGEAFKEMAVELFALFPEMEKFSWSQYTPYFNDGDPCVFRVNTDPYINDSELWDFNDNEYEKRKPMYEAVGGFLCSFDDEILKDMYGDHVEITIYRDGRAEVEEYSHD